MIVAILIDLLIAGIAGWLAGKIMHYEKSILCNIILGLIGGTIGAFVLGIFGLHGGGIVGGIIVSVIGACILVWLARILLK